MGKRQNSECKQNLSRAVVLITRRSPTPHSPQSWRLFFTAMHLAGRADAISDMHKAETGAAQVLWRKTRICDGARLPRDFLVSSISGVFTIQMAPCRVWKEASLRFRTTYRRTVPRMLKVASQRASDVSLSAPTN